MTWDRKTRWSQTVRHAHRNREALKGLTVEERVERYVTTELERMMTHFQEQQDRFTRGICVHEEDIVSIETDLSVYEKIGFTRELIWEEYSKQSLDLYFAGLETNIRFVRHNESNGWEDENVSFSDDWDYLVVICKLPKEKKE